MRARVRLRRSRAGEPSESPRRPGRRSRDVHGRRGIVSRLGSTGRACARCGVRACARAMARPRWSVELPGRQLRQHGSDIGFVRTGSPAPPPHEIATRCGLSFAKRSSISSFLIRWAVLARQLPPAMGKRLRRGIYVRTNALSREITRPRKGPGMRKHAITAVAPRDRGARCCRRGGAGPEKKAKRAES